MSGISIFGEVLVDQFPDGSRILGGAPFNVAWHLQAFGQAPQFISRIGNDADGRQIEQAMQQWGLDCRWLQHDSSYPTGAVSVSLDHGQPQFNILPQQAYDFIDVSQLPSHSGDWLYHGSLALRHAVSAQALAQLKQQHGGQILIDVNLRQPWWQAETLHDYLAAADWLKLNQDELTALQPQSATVAAAMQALITRYDLSGVVVTLGEHGAQALSASGEHYQVVPSQTVTVIDTVGAGDAFAAVLLLGLQQHWPLPTLLERAQAFASALVGQRGATVADRSFYKSVANDWQLNSEAAAVSR